MEQSDLKPFCTMLIGVYEYYGKKVPSDMVIRLYWDGLKDLPYKQVQDAFAKHLQNSDAGQYIPRIANIRFMILGSSSDVAMSAWVVVDKAIRSVGPYQSVAFADPLINRVLSDMGGWSIFHDKTDDKWPFIANEFQNRYRSIKSKNEKFEYPPYLCGITERDNATTGKPIAPPLLIGSPYDAMETLNSGSSSGVTLQVTRILENQVPAITNVGVGSERKRLR